MSIYAVTSMKRNKVLCWTQLDLTVRAPHKEMAEDRGIPEFVTVFKTGPATWSVVEEDKLGEYLTEQVKQLCIDHYLANTPSICERSAACSCGDSENYLLSCKVHGMNADERFAL